MIAGQNEALRRAAVGRQAFDDAARGIDAGQHRHAMDMAAETPAPAGIENAQYRKGRVRRAAHLADEGLGRVVGAHQQHRHGERAQRAASTG